jgi:hypothetical protein
MISKCANPACSAHFLYLHQGRVFRVMRVSDNSDGPEMGLDPTLKKRQHVEFFWLCDRCKGTLTIRYNKDGAVTVQPIRAALRAAS